MPIFETSAADPLGLWDSAPQSVSFGIGDAEPNSPQPVEAIYRVNLPADPAASKAAFRSSESAVEQVNAALESVPARLDGLVAQTQSNRQKQESGVSFDIQPLEPGPESDLLSLLDDADRAGLTGSVPGEVSFGLNEEISGALGAAKTQFESLLAQIDRDILHFAWVETTIAGQLIAHTTVDWSGDAQTAWAEGIDGEQASLHQSTLKTVTQTRNLRLRLFVTVASGAAKVASLMATPGGAVLALPVVYKYVLQIVAQARQLQIIQSS